MNFMDFARTHGLEIKDLRVGEKIWRCATSDHPRSTNGAYFFDGRRGWVQNWATGQPLQWWQDQDSQPWTEAEKREWARRRTDERRRRAQLAKKAAQKAAQLIAEGKQDHHDYLARKGFKEARGIVAPDGSLVVPMRDVETYELVGAQLISYDGKAWVKKMVYGMKAAGAVLRIGSQSGESVLCEGYSTALSIAAAIDRLNLRIAVYATFSADNLARVAPMISGKRYVFADHDTSQTGQLAADRTGLPWVMSDTEGDDANDLHQRDGLIPVCRLLTTARNAREGGRAQ